MFIPLQNPHAAGPALIQPLTQGDSVQMPPAGEFAALMQIAGDKQSNPEIPSFPLIDVSQVKGGKQVEDSVEAADGMLEEVGLQDFIFAPQPQNWVAAPVLTVEAMPLQADAGPEPRADSQGATQDMAATDAANLIDPARRQPSVSPVPFLRAAENVPASANALSVAVVPAQPDAPLVAERVVLSDHLFGQEVALGKARNDGGVPVAPTKPALIANPRVDDPSAGFNGAADLPRLPDIDDLTAAMPPQHLSKPLQGKVAEFDSADSSGTLRPAETDPPPDRPQSSLTQPLTALAPSQASPSGVMWTSAARPLAISPGPVSAGKSAAKGEKMWIESEPSQPEPAFKGQPSAVVVVRQPSGPLADATPPKEVENEPKDLGPDPLPFAYGVPLRHGQGELVEAPRPPELAERITVDAPSLPVATALPEAPALVDAMGPDVATPVATLPGLSAAPAYPVPIGNDIHPHPVRQLAEAIVTQPDGVKPGRIELILAPDTLGRVHFDIQTDKHGLTITLSAERSETLDLIRRSLPDLVAELRQVGIEGGSFHFGSWNGNRHAPEPIPLQPFAADSPAPPDFQAQQKVTTQLLGSGGLNMRL